MSRGCEILERVQELYLKDIDDSCIHPRIGRTQQTQRIIDSIMTLDEMLLMMQLGGIILKTCGPDAKTMICDITAEMIKVDVKPSPKTGVNNLIAETINTDIIAIVIPNIEYSIRFLIKRKKLL